MKTFILSRYILREHIGPFFFGFSIITLIFLLNLLFRELSRILSKGLPWHVVLEFFMLNLAWIVALAVPMAVLVATLMAFGRLAADNEITAIRASGVSLYHIVGPVLIAGGAIAAGMVWFNNAVLPDFNHQARLLAGDIARKRPGVSIEPGIWYDDIPNYGLLVQELIDSAGVTKAWNLLIDDHSDADKSRTISASQGYIELNPRSGALNLTLFDGEIQELDIKKPEEFRRVIFSKHLVSIAVDDMFLRRSESEYRGDREKSAQQMLQEVTASRAQSQSNMQNLKEIVARDLYRAFGTSFGIAGNAMDSLLTQTPAASLIDNYRGEAADYGILRKDFPITYSQDKPAGLPANNHAPSPRERLYDLLRAERQVLHAIESELGILRSYQRTWNGLLVEIHKKYSIPVACVVFVLIGAPLGVMARRGSLAAGGGLSLGFFLVYWAFLIGGEDLADRQIISPFIAMWAANLIVGCVGLYLLRRAAKETISLDFTRLLWWRKR
jgi:lipopolysaccharide export system permease protein